jgi:hypothetical protein
MAKVAALSGRKTQTAYVGCATRTLARALPATRECHAHFAGVYERLRNRPSERGPEFHSE